MTNFELRKWRMRNWELGEVGDERSGSMEERGELGRLGYCGIRGTVKRYG